MSISSIQDIDLSLGETKRMSCIECGGYNSLTITRTSKGVLYNCYRVSCKLSGGKLLGLTRDTLETALRKPVTASKPKPLPTPHEWVNVARSPASVAWLKAWHSWEAVEAGLCEVRYDLREDRIVFLVYNEGILVDAAGRALNKAVYPKWKRYGTSTVPFMCGTGDIGVIVEDAFSACAVTSVQSGEFTGVALMGTSLSPEHKQHLRRFRALIVALDKDATKKSIDMARELAPIAPTRVAVLEHDLKKLDALEICRALS
jgi:hypothetical protein